MPLEGHKQISTDAKYERQKPPHSYIALIATAILSSTEKKLTLTEINEYLITNYAFFRGSYQGWKNSVRHNLSFNKCFVKILRDPSRPWGKDNYWTVCSLRDYLLSDGTFRRRRKRKPKRKEEEEEEASEAPNQLEENSTGRKPKLVKARFSLPTQAVQSDRTQRDVFAESKSTAPRFRGAFSIASILSDERRNEERPARIYHTATPVQASRQIGEYSKNEHKHTDTTTLMPSQVGQCLVFKINSASSQSTFAP